MCGFSGFLNLKNRSLKQAQITEILSKMGAEIAHRGPDEQTFHTDANISIVFRRLSIIDLLGGHQPIWNEDRSAFVVANGEIYNHRELQREFCDSHTFRTHSDSEILVHMYEQLGENFIEKLHGKFAFAIWDVKRQKLVLGRDRMGIKPLFYFHKPGSLFLFGSEVKALMVHPECPKGVRWEAMPEHSHLVMSNPTYQEGIEQLPGGSLMVIDSQANSEMRKYWDFKKILNAPRKRLDNPQEYFSRYADLFGQAIERRLMSDVPIGAFLSGGLDSSLMVSAAAKKHQSLECFTVVEKGTVETGDVAAAIELTQQLGIRLHKVLFDHRTLLEELKFDLTHLEYFVRVMERPVFQLEWFIKHELHRYAKTVKPNIKVMLIGQGSDEYSGGYSHLDSSLLASKDWDDYLNRTVSPLSEFRVAEMKRIPQSLRPFLSTEFILGLDAFTGDQYDRYMLDSWSRLEAYNLWHEDRTSSAQGIEARLPFLDHELVEFLATIPPELKKELFWDKRIVREAAKRWLPENLAERRKIGFIYGPDRSSADKMYRDIVNRTYQEFRHKYLENGQAIYKIERFDDEARRAGHSNVPAKFAKALIDLMCFVIFKGWLDGERTETTVRQFRPPSPLKELSEIPQSFWPKIQSPMRDRLSQASAREILQTPLFLNKEVEVRLRPPKRIEFLIAGVVVDSITPGQDFSWLFDILTQSMLFPKNPILGNDLVKKFDLDTEGAMGTLAYLISRDILSFDLPYPEDSNA